MFAKFSLKSFFEEILLYSGQFGLFYIIMQLIVEGTGFFVNFGHIGLFITLIVQALILSVKGKTTINRVAFSFLVPVVYSCMELEEGTMHLFNAAHVGFWIYAVVSSLVMVLKQKGEEVCSRISEIILVIVNINIFIFIYFYFDTWKEVENKDLLAIQYIFNFTDKFLSDPTHWFIILGGCFLALTVALGRYEIAKLKDRIYALFGKYVDENVRDNIIRDGHMVARRENLCILFSDIKSFTTLCENNDAGHITDMLNLYFEAWNSVVKKHNGIVDKYIGDAIMVLFGLEDATNACDAAVASSIEMQERYQKLVEVFKQKRLPVPEGYGVGCHFGELIIGDIGSSDRKNFTVVGDTVNIASRLEAVSRDINSQIIITADLYHKLSEEYKQQFTNIGPVDLKGKQQKIEAWAIN